MAQRGDGSTRARKASPRAEGTSTAAGARSPAARADLAAGKGSAPAGAAPHERASGEPASHRIQQRIRDLGGWRGETLARMRALILEADPEMTEEWKWMGTPVWSHHGNVCTGEAYAKVVKLTFARGARVPDPSHLFNASLEGGTRRAIDIHEGERVDARAFQALLRAAVALNEAPARLGAKVEPRARKATPTRARAGERAAAVLLSGGNPQIAKADGDAPVQAYISALPGWKRDLGLRLDALIARSVPHVRRAVKWNSPLYGLESKGWFLGAHAFDRYVKVTFFRGSSLRPVPPGGTARSKDSRWIDLRESDALDEAQLVRWVKQAAALPGWIP